MEDCRSSRDETPRIMSCTCPQGLPIPLDVVLPPCRVHEDPSTRVPAHGRALVAILAGWLVLVSAVAWATMR